MGGRGTFAAGNPVRYSYQTVDYIEGVKVLEGINGKHGLPEEAHSSTAYIALKPDGVFHEMRIYDENHFLIKEIAYHPEPKINNGNRQENVLHVHDYPERNNFENRPVHRISKEEYELYKKFFKGVPKIEKW
jgi:hypothetical protein